MENPLTPQRKRELLTRAENLSQLLNRSDIKRSEWSHVLNTLFRPAPGTSVSMHQATTLLKLLPTCGLQHRAGRTRDRLKLIFKEFLELKKASLSAEEWRFVVGWTARYLRTMERR